MKKFDFSAIRKSIFLMLFMMIAFVGFSQGTDDFNSLQTSTSYQTVTSSDGWYCVNAAVNAASYTIGTCDRKYVVINGKTTAVGSITSPDLTGGCGTLSLSYGNVFAENNGVSFKIQVKNLTDEVLYETIVTKANSEVTKGETYNFTADVNQAGDFKIHIQNLSPSHNTSNKDRLAISCIEWTAYGTPAAVAAPTCTPAAGMFYAAQEVTLATTTVGATIYYSLDGSTPSLLYNDPIEISEATTLKAFAVLGEDTSAVTTAEYTFPVNAATIAELKANGVQNTIYKVAEDVVVIFQNGKYLFVQDNDNALVVYDNFQVVDTYNAGDVISGGFFGKYTVYNNMNELTTVNDAPAFPAGVAGTPVEPTVATVSEVANNYLTWESKLVKFENVTFVDADHFTQGDDTMKVYNMFGTSCSLAAGYTANVTGLIGKFHDDVQILPRTNADVEVLSAPAAELPYRVDFDDNIDENLAINNGNYTNKWYIGKAQDFDNNKLYISSSIGRTNKYNNEAASEVTVSRNLVIPAKGAIVTFDCRYKGEDNKDYLQFDVIGENQTISKVVNNTDNNWQNVTMSIPSDMAGIVTVKFTWRNDDRNGEQYPAAIDNIYIYESPCTQPTALQTSVDTTSATITWSGDAAAYLLQYKISTRGDDEWYSVNVNDTTLTLTDLQSNSDYNVKVQSVCEGFVSAAAEGSFTVDCQNWEEITTERDVTVGTGNINNTTLPFTYNYGYEYSQQIYTAEEIGSGIYTINSISFYPNASPTSTGNIKIWLANVDKDYFSSNTDYVNPSELTLVCSIDGSYSYRANTWNTFTFTTPFEYTGGNLLVAYYEGMQGYGSSSVGFKSFSATENQAIYHRADDGASVSYLNPSSASAYSKGTIKDKNIIILNISTSTLVCGDPILCPAVTDVTVSDITSEGATISWTPGAEDEASFIVEYQLAGDETWTLADANVTTTTYTLTGLAPMANYQVRVKANCGTYNVSESQLSEQFRTKGICAPVTEISHYNLATTAVLTWTPGADENAWTVKFKPTAADESAWVMIPVQGQATASLGGLQAQTAYDVQILALCEGDQTGLLSEWATYSFTSACASVEIPVTYTLKSDDHDCWEAEEFNFTYSGATSSITNAFLISPSFTIPSEGQYYVSFDAEGSYQLLASYRGTREDRFEVLAEVNNTTGLQIFAISESYLGRGVNFKIVNTAPMFNGLTITNFKVNECPFATTNLTVSNLTSNSATLSWTASELATNFQIKVNEETFIDVEGATTYTLTDLQESTPYTVAVRSHCGEDAYSEWSNTINFTTPCAAFTVPYFEGFESGYTNASAVAGCISQEKISGSNVWIANNSLTDYNRAPRTGSWNAYLQYSNTRWMYIPMHFEANKQYIFEMYARQDATSGCSMKVAYGTSNTSSAMTNTIVNSTNIGSSFVKLSSMFAPTATGDYYVGIYATLTSAPWYVSIDDISIIEVPTCGVPTLAVNSSAVATITPNEIGTPESYDLAIGEDTVTNVAGPTVDLTTIFTLAPNTEYAVSVRANCGDEDGQSLWSDPVSFTTPCMALDLPYTEDFEGTATTFPSMCWSSYYVSGPGTKNWVSTTDQKHSGSRAAKTQDQSATTIHNLVTPQLNISKASGAVLTFWVYRVNDSYSSSSYSQEGVKVLYCDNIEGNNATELKYIHRHITYQPVETAAGWYEYSAIIPQGQYYVIFQGINQYGGSTYIDDISVEEAPTCFTPTDLTVVSAADTTAQLAWTDQLHQPAYKVQYRLAGESTWQEVTGITETNCTLHNLQPSSDYEARVLADCGEGDESEATEIVSFTTMCLGGTSMEIAIGSGTSTSNYLPSNINYNYSLTQQIYTAEEINFTGNLNSVSFYNTSSSAVRNLSVYLVHTEKTSFSGISDWITVSESDKVFEGDVTFIQNDWTNIAFDRLFAYNGTSNVALIVDDNSGNYPGSKYFRVYNAGSYRALYAYYDYANFDPTNPGSMPSSATKSTSTSLNQVRFGGIYCPPTCPNPTDLAAVNVTANAATITWTAGGSETAWNVEYGKAGFTPGEGTMLAVEEASVELTGLEMGVAYDVYVQANCAEDDQSEWAGPAKFVTECEAIATLPYTQDFEGETFEPACWSQEQFVGDDLWELVSDGRNQFAMFPYYLDNSADLITPVFDLSTYESVMVTFDHVQWPYNVVDKLELLYRTSEAADWTLLQEYADATGEYIEPRVWKNERVILPAEALVENVQFAFRGIGLDGNSIYLDNVVVMEVPDCYAPTALTLNDVTTTTAQISWTAGDDVQTAWNVQYGEHNFTLGEGTIISNLDTTAVELTALMSGTAYDVYVQAVCDEVSAWAGPVVLVTECVTINSLPYTQDFGGDFFEPICWSQEQVSGSHSWVLYGDNTGNVFVGFPDVTPYDANNSSADLITPIFNLSSYESVMMSFDHVQWPKKGVVDKLGLFYRTSEDVDWTLIKEYTEATGEYSNPLDWKNEKIILPEEVLTDNVQFAFRGTEMNGYYIYFDNVVLMETPCGHIEDLAVAQDSMTDTRAYITWNGVAEEYSLEYKEADDETWTVVPVTGKAQWLTDLTPSTSYNVRVKAVCAEETQYSEVIDFETYCLGYYFDKYGAVQCPELHNDLTVNNLSVFRTACEIHAPVVVKVTNNAYMDTITSLNLYYVVNNGDTVAETLTMTTPLCYQNETTYTFNEIPVFEEGNNTVYAWVEYNENVFRANNVSARILNPIDEYPYYNTLKNVVAYDGWNAYDVNEDNVTMISNSNGLTYRYNDTLDANDWMITPCFYFEPGKYVISYSYNANSVLKESFEFWYGNGANVADMTTMLRSEEFSGTTVATSTFEFDVTEAGVYNFGFWATSLAGNLGFNITNFSIEPVNIVTITTDGNGTTTPSGEVYVNYNNNLTLNIVPNVNYHLSAIYVDSVQVMGEDPYASRFVMYTLENVTEPHDVFVEFKLEFHTHKIVSNYNPAYDQTEGGYFVPATSDTTIRVSDHTVFFAPNEHYHFNSLTLSEMDETDPVDFTDSVVYDETTGLYAFTFYNLTVPEYFVNAQFRRDTVNIHYTALTGQGYADASPRMIAGDSVFGEYDTWVDYDIHGDLDTTITITPAGDYHIVNVYVNGQPQNVESDEFHYTFSNVTETQYVDVNFGYQVTASIRNYVPTYLGSDEVRGTIAPDTQLVAEGYPTVITGTVQEHFHLYNLFVDGVDMIDQVVFDGYNYSLTIDSTIANYNIEAVVKIDTMGIHYEVMDGQGYADASNLLVAPADYITWVNYGDDFMMNLTPDRGFSIGSVIVDGENMYTANNYLFNNVVEHHYVAVTFVPNDYTITTNAYGQGVVSEGMSFTYDPANPVNYVFTANAAEGYHISAVLVNDVEQDLTDITNVYTLPLNDVADNYVINAIFEINTYNMVSEASLGGTITPEGLQVVNHGTDLTYEIVADEGRYISSITIDGITVEYTQADNVTNYIQLFTSINADHSISVTFAVKHFTITAEVNEEANHGTIDGVSSFSGEFSYGSNQTLNFIPEENYQVSDVVVDGQSVGAVASYEFVNITAEHNVVVSFAPVQYTLTATSNVPACTITPATTTVQAGSNVNYTMTVATGYHLLNVIANGEEVSVIGNAFTIANVQEDYEIFANFAPNYVTVTVEQPAHATITPGTMTYAYGATPSYVIVPEVGYNVTAVHAGNTLVNVTYNNGIGSFTLNPVTADVTLTATTAIKTFTITATQAAHGTISPVAVQTVNYGGNVTYTITPDDYYEIVDVLVDGASRGAISTYTFNNVTANHTIEAVFEAVCMTPSRLAVVYVDTNSATLTWEGNADSYEVRYRAAGQTNFTTQTVTTNTITLTGLTPNTLYAWGVKANCTASMSSDWAESAFTTNAVIPPVGISTADLSSIKVYSHLNNVYIVNENGIAIENVTIYNIFGAQVYTGKANNNPEIISLDVANGNYIVRLSTENGVGVYKLSIVR